MALDKKQIALSVAGIIASLTLTYLLYRQQQKENAASAAANAAASEAAVSDTSAQYQYTQDAENSVSVPSISGSVSTTAPGSDADTDTSGTDLISSILAAFAGGNNSTTSAPMPDLTIPLLPPSTDPALATVPTTAQQAQQGVATTLGDDTGNNAIFGGIVSTTTTPAPVTAAPVSVTTSPTYSNSTGDNGYETNLARNNVRSLAVN